MAHTDNKQDAAPRGHGPVIGLGDVVFILLLAAAMVAVVFSGRFAYREGTLLETAKGNAQEFVKWAEAVSAGDGKAEPFTLALCSSMPGALPPELAAGVAPEGAPGLPATAKEGAEGAVAAASAVVPVVAHGAAHGAPSASTAAVASSAASAGGHGSLAQGLQAMAQAVTHKVTDSVTHAVAQAAHGASATPGAEPAQAAASAPEGEHSDGAPATPKVATTWATCREALFTAGGPLSHLSNPFDATIPVASNKCERRNRATRGVVYIQKGTMPPPGMPGSVSWAPIEDEEPMVRGLMLKVQACDAGGYPISIGEVKL